MFHIEICDLMKNAQNSVIKNLSRCERERNGVGKGGGEFWDGGQRAAK